MAEDVPTSLLDELRAASVRRGSCAVCEWIAEQPNADEWDAVMAAPWQDINSRVVHRKMVKLGYAKSDNTVSNHRTKGHRVPA